MCIRDRYVAIDSRGIVQNPADGNLYIKHYWGGIYKLNTDPFDGSVELIHNIGGGQEMFTFSADGQYIIIHSNGQISKYDFNTGELITTTVLEGTVQGFSIAHTGEYLITFGGGEILNAHDEQGNYIGQITFPESIYHNYALSYANGLCFTNRGGPQWTAWDIDDGFILSLIHI